MRETSAHPIRLVVTDDLHRSRLTVLFRIVLVIPHVFWLALFGIVEVVVVIINWFATLITGRSPEGLHDFLTGYLRYVTHVNAYFWIAANPYPRFFLGSRLEPYPVDLELDRSAPQHRLKVLFRLVLAIPALLIGGGGMGGSGSGAGRNAFNLGVTPMAGILLWFSSLVRGRAPRGLRDMAAWGIGYGAHMYGYLFVVTDRYPYTGPDLFLRDLEPPEVDPRVPRLVNADDLRRSRLTVFFRLPLAIPHVVWLLLWSVVATVVAILTWVATLATGRPPAPFARFLAAYVRYSTHVSAFLYVMANPFPGFVGAAGSYPLEPRLAPVERQSRWITLGRIVLAVPAALASSALSGVLFLAALCGWFVSLVLGRMPSGLQLAGAYALGYAAQLWSYLLLLTDRYPHASPAAVLEGFVDRQLDLPLGAEALD